MLNSIAFIPDGNRRFAHRNALDFAKSYSAGFEKTKEVFNWCLEVPNLREMTIWAISTENLRRSGAELRIFTHILEKKLVAAKSDPMVNENGVRINVVGSLQLLPKAVREAASELMSSTAHYTNYALNLAIGYGGRQEMLDAITSLVSQNLPVTEENLSNCMYTRSSPDLIVRTGGEQRLSGFMPWQAAYSELYFSKKLWPEFDREEFDKAVDSYNSRERRFGL